MKRSLFLYITTLFLCSNSITCDSYFTPSYEEFKDNILQWQEDMQKYNAALTEQEKLEKQLEAIQILRPLVPLFLRECSNLTRQHLEQKVSELTSLQQNTSFSTIWNSSDADTKNACNLLEIQAAQKLLGLVTSHSSSTGAQTYEITLKTLQHNLIEQELSAAQYLEKLTKKEALVASYHMLFFSDNFYN